MSIINITLPDQPFAVQEAMNRLRVNVKFSGKGIKSIMVTSSVPNEGKSHVSVSLWRLLAEGGFRTVLVDCDLRKSVLKTELNYVYEGEYQGLDYYLSGLAEYSDVVHQTNVEHADIVPITNLLQNPSTLLEDDRFRDLFQKLRADYDYVIVDTPPLISVSDAALIVQNCDGAILVVRSGMTPRSLVRKSLGQLERSNCHVLGTVLNGVKAGTSAYGKYYGKHYGGYYGRYYGNYYGDYYGNNEHGKSKKKD